MFGTDKTFVESIELKLFAQFRRWNFGKVNAHTHLTLTCFVFHQTMFADRIPVTMVDLVLKKALPSAVYAKLVITGTDVNVSEMI